MYAVVWVPDRTASGATGTAQAVKIDNYYEHEVAADGTLTVHCLQNRDRVPAPRLDRQLAAPALSRGRPTSFSPGGWVLFELFGADGTRFKAKRPRAS
ncbi:MAG TPA: hypothetical protein VMZ00_05460 [Sporichthya sp.]|nr:hypothetical protein [Sporichthya sp.]